MRIITIGLLALAFTGCGQFQRSRASLTGYGETCVRGVLYYQFASGAALAVDADGKPLRCEP